MIIPGSSQAVHVLALATANLGKIKEFEALLGPLHWHLQNLKQTGLSLPAEETSKDGATLESNATLKAEHVSRALNCWALADDSGLFVEALPQVLGVDTATYGGTAKLLAAMKNVVNRQAELRCVLALARPNQPTLLFKGVDHGSIATDAEGTAGLTYDPVFIQDGETLTNAQRIELLGLAQVKGAGHRGRAIQAFLNWALQNSRS